MTVVVIRRSYCRCYTCVPPIAHRGQCAFRIAEFSCRLHYRYYAIREYASERLNFFLEQLLLVKVGVQSLVVNQFLVGAPLHHFSLLHDENEIGVL